MRHFAEFTDQMADITETYCGAGAFRVWVGPHPIVAVCRAEYVEVN